MKTALKGIGAFCLGLTAVLAPQQAGATSLDEVVARLEKVEAENMSLRARLRKVEGNAQPAQAVVVRPKGSAVVDPMLANARLETKAAAGDHSRSRTSWTGLYAGLNLGGAWGRETGFEAIRTVETGLRVAGVSGGAQVGVNLQYGRAVAGAELTGDWRHVTGNSTIEGGGGSALNPQGALYGDCARQSDAPFGLAGAAYKTFACKARQDWTASLLSKFGYSVIDDSLLLYGKGGVSISHFRFSEEMRIFANGISNAPSTISGSASRILVGATVGGGLEYRVPFSKLSVGAEYLYSMYGSQPFANFYAVNLQPQGNQGPFVGLTPAGGSNHGLDTQLARVFLNYSFSE